MNKTTIYLTSMIPCIIFGKYGWNFIFVDTKNNKYARSEDETKAWLLRNNIKPDEFVSNCWAEYNSMKDAEIEYGLISYFTKDDEKIYNYAKTLDVKSEYEKVFDF